jgi:hypothetical protein
MRHRQRAIEPEAPLLERAAVVGILAEIAREA